jgi:hypothetical protein
VKEEIKKLMNEILETQQEKVLKCGQTFRPNLTSEDVLQPVDYPELEYNPHFRYEEGVLEGIHTLRSAILALLNEGL